MSNNPVFQMALCASLLGGVKNVYTTSEIVHNVLPPNGAVKYKAVIWSSLRAPFQGSQTQFVHSSQQNWVTRVGVQMVVNGNSAETIVPPFWTISRVAQYGGDNCVGVAPKAVRVPKANVHRVQPPFRK